MGWWENGEGKQPPPCHRTFPSEAETGKTTEQSQDSLENVVVIHMPKKERGEEEEEARSQRKLGRG